MPKPPLPADVVAALEQPWHATISCLKPNGAPVSVPTWYLFENGRVLVNMDGRRKRLDWMRADPRVALSAIDPEDWITHVSLQGRIVEFVDDPELVDIDRIATHYTGRPYAVRDRSRVSAWIELDQWHGWGRLKQG